MQFDITIPESISETTIKQLLEEEFLIPRKIRHFLRIKKHVFLNQEPVHWQTVVKKGDLLTLEFDEEDYPNKTIPMGNANEVEALYEDEHLIVVNKPEGMKTHGNEPTEIALLNHVSAYVGKTCYVVHPFVLPIVNRLLEEKRIYRNYWALVDGPFKSKKVTYKDKIGRDRHDRRKRVVDPRKGQTAITIIERLKQFGDKSLVDCQLKTGRTHQIRVHLSYHGHPIVGDPLYNKKPGQRLMLHAHRLSLKHPFKDKVILVNATSNSFEKELKKNSRTS